MLRILLADLSGCARLNHPLTRPPDGAGYRFQNFPSTDENSDEVFVVLAFSGGGTRAAALSYGVLKELRETFITVAGRKRRLLDEVDMISSVSGGSFTAAYYGLHGDKIFEEFETRFLRKKVEWNLWLRMLSPLNWVRLASPAFSRIDVAAEFYDEFIFDHHKFSDLVDRGKRPFIVINATDITYTSRFEFTQEQFDLLYSDLSSYPIARAVAASSAFPFLFTPLTLKNYPRAPSFREPGWVDRALTGADKSERVYEFAVHQRSYANTARCFVHLLDGGISDNLGLRGTWQDLASVNGSIGIRSMINLREIKKLVLIVVNARPDPETSWDGKQNPPGIFSVFGIVASGPMNNYSFETVQLLWESVEDWKHEAQAREDCDSALRDALLAADCPDISLPGTPPPDVEYFPIEVSFDRVPEESRRKRLKSIGTRLQLPVEEVSDLIDAGRDVLRSSPVFQRFVAGE